MTGTGFTHRVGMPLGFAKGMFRIIKDRSAPSDWEELDELVKEEGAKVVLGWVKQFLKDNRVYETGEDLADWIKKQTS